ncbi:IS66 family insertion sequence element accessory protein TnpB [Sinorhizobium medicae]|nr:IS66 family insertion sequence element accessory protein TnpB [Sinorhizobium medicae]
MSDSVNQGRAFDPSQLYGWRRKALASGSVVPLSKEANERVSFARVEAVASSPVEIVMGDVVVRVAGDIEPDHLAKILRAVRKA